MERQIRLRKQLSELKIKRCKKFCNLPYPEHNECEPDHSKYVYFPQKTMKVTFSGLMECAAFYESRLGSNWWRMYYESRKWGMIKLLLDML